MKIFSILLPILLPLFCYLDRPQIKDSNFSGSELLEKNILLVPINLTETQLGLLKDKEITDLESGIISFNKDIEKEIIARVDYFKVNLDVLPFSQKNIYIFNELYKELEKNYFLIKEKRKELNRFPKPKPTEEEVNQVYKIYYQPKLNKIETIDFSNSIEENETPKRIKTDYILLYKINYYSDSIELKLVKGTAMTFIIVFATAISGTASFPKYEGSIFEGGDLQFILIDYQKKKVVSFGEFSRLNKEEKKLNQKVILNFVHYILGLDLK